MTVGQLKAELAKYDEGLAVGGSDDMGQIEHIDAVSFCQILRDAPYVALDIQRGWREPDCD